ncbi:hypothetical protein C0991_007163 [Blastosporella zonata]|nr:hypothetical protein C0991_007163 [Blastosporella zonata]
MKIKDTLFKVWDGSFRRHSEFFSSASFHPLLDIDKGVEGSDDEHPLVLEGVEVTDFEKLLWIIYPPVIGAFKAKTAQDWTAVLDLASRWKFKDIRELSIKELAKFEIDPIEKIELQQKYEVKRQWAWSAFNTLCSRTNGLDVGEGRRLGVETVIDISAVRERLEKWGRKKPEERHTPWWARWTLGLIACDVFMTGSAIELTYNNWSTLVSDLEKSATEINGNEAPNSEHYVLRPGWQRIGVCAAHMVFGAGIAGALLIAQTRFVRTLAIIPPSENEGRRLFLQCAHNLAKRGIVFPLSKCTLGKGRNATELILRVAGERGHWYIGFENSNINGKRLTGHEARTEVLAAWNGKSKSLVKPKLEVDKRWRSGPVRRGQ